MTIIDWLLDADPAIRWQVMRDLTRCARGRGHGRTREGRDRRLGRQAARAPAARRRVGRWRLFPEWKADRPQRSSCCETFGLEPQSRRKRDGPSPSSRANAAWEYDDQPYFDGEVEPCINGRAVAIGAYFGEDVRGIVDRLLTEQMEDGGWNCEQENGSRAGRSTRRSTCSRASSSTSGPPARSRVTAARSAGRSTCSSGSCSAGSRPARYRTAALAVRLPSRTAGTTTSCAGSTTCGTPPSTPDERMAEAIDIVTVQARRRWPMAARARPSRRAACRPRRARG